MTYFATDYFAARAGFRQGVAALGWHLESHLLPARGPAGQPLTVDVAWSTARQARQVLVITSGLHGVEGFCGSAVQAALLERWRKDPAATRGVRIVLVHALNPYGFAHLRRCDERNVDPNRNFLPAGERYRGCHPLYHDLHDWLNPRPGQTWRLARLAPMAKVWRHRWSRLKTAVAGGQYDYPEGLFFGGSAPSSAMAFLEANLQRLIGGATRVLHLDVHTGLGGWGRCVLLADHPFHASQAAWLRRCIGAANVESCANPIIAYPARGGLGPWCAAHLGNLDYAYLCVEFGTYSALQVLAGLRMENFAHHWQRADARALRQRKRRLKELFCPASPTWRRGVLRQADALVHQALEGLRK